MKFQYASDQSLMVYRSEVPEAIADGTQEAFMPCLTSVNIACGGHAGDEAAMRATVEEALRWQTLPRP
jgi:lactam utilization protein B